MSEYRKYRDMSADLAGRMLNAAAGAVNPSLPIASLLPAARLVLSPTSSDGSRVFDPLASGMRLLASMGRAHGRSLVRLRDPAGHSRTLYHLLALHLHLLAFERCYEALPQSVWSACEAALPEAIEPARLIEDHTDAPPPAEEVDLALWQALCLLEQAILLQRDVDIEVVDSAVFSLLAAGPAGPSDESAPLHAYDPDRSLDNWTYRELAGLHALAALAVRRRNREWSRRVEQIAAYHLEHTQPDYTTYQPWAVFAFAWSPATRPFADQQLLDARTHLAACGQTQGEGSVDSPSGRTTGETTGGGRALIPGALLADAAAIFDQFE